ncbi:uncharacterized protein LOC105699731 isoform X2 [Orussus abietinus]|uniref:uncharacterized protein LOC105699731 isoform X2 n=1 Tax=Orussus abietinus TaxID=222816 RepID=UPI000C716163|nr:uncharacterized protein LOC105699731 isoform X2 [Orussus abietinus]
MNVDANRRIYNGPRFKIDGPATFEPRKSGSRGASIGTGAGETELGMIKVVAPTSSVATSTPLPAGGIPCRNGGCKASRSRGEPRPESPWHLLKTIFLVSVIVALIVWVIVYTLLAQYQIL